MERIWAAGNVPLALSKFSSSPVGDRPAGIETGSASREVLVQQIITSLLCCHTGVHSREKPRSRSSVGIDMYEAEDDDKNRCERHGPHPDAWKRHS